MSNNPDLLYENEWYIVRHSGESPEIAYNSAVYFLTRSKSGPKIELSESQLLELKNAAVIRFEEIVLRDLLYENWDKPIYRGVQRSIVNFGRFCTFCQRQDLDPSPVAAKAALTLQAFLETCCTKLNNGEEMRIINCSFSDICQYAEQLGQQISDRFKILADFCQAVE